MMMNRKTLSLLLLTVASGMSFTPQGNTQRHGLANRRMQLYMGKNNNELKDRVENQVDDLKKKVDRNVPNELKEKIDEKTDFLFVDMNKARNDLAKNWGWITGSGILTMALGALALYLPVTATGAAYTGTVLTIGAAGFVGIANAFVAENGHKAKSALSGIGYGALAYYMGTHPGQGLNIITLTIASVLAVEGIYEIALAAKNENLHARGWHFASGIVSSIAGLGLSASIPAASLVVPGAALGLRLTSNGASKVAIGLTGKDIANERKN